MADRRRRRKLGGDEDSEAGSDASEEEQNGVRRSAAVSFGEMRKGYDGEKLRTWRMSVVWEEGGAWLSTALFITIPGN